MIGSLIQTSPRPVYAQVSAPVSAATLVANVLHAEVHQQVVHAVVQQRVVVANFEIGGVRNINGGAPVEVFGYYPAWSA